jgi:pimeloyl-ACP methyl ester carboxylesterase
MRLSIPIYLCLAVNRGDRDMPLSIPLRQFALAGAALTVLAGPVAAAADLPQNFPKSFHTEEIPTNGTTLHVRVGGSGPAVLLLHGYGDTGDMWAPLAAKLAVNHTVIVPDLRGLGLSARAETGFEKANQAEDIAGVMDALHAPRAEVVAHDIGNMVAYALATRHAERVTKLVLMDAPVPGVGPWDEVLKSPLLWHFRFGGPDMERLVAGRERIYLDRFWNEFSADPAHFPEDARAHYAELYAAPGRMHAGFRQFAAFDQDALDNRAWLAAHGKLNMPVLAIAGAASFGPVMAVVAQAAAIDVQERIIPGSGHWLMEEQPAATVEAIDAFLNGQPSAAKDGHLAQAALSLEQAEAMPQSGAGAGTSGVGGISTVLLYGDPAKPGPYMLEIHVPANTAIAPHVHRDDRFATVISGDWYFGYGARVDDAAVKPLTAGGFYTEPGGAAHFAFTRSEPAVVRLTGNGPSDTAYVAVPPSH